MNAGSWGSIVVIGLGALAFVSWIAIYAVLARDEKKDVDQ